MKVSIETNKSRIVIEDAFTSGDVNKFHEHNEKLVKLAYQYVVQNDLMCMYENGNIVMVNKK